MKIVLGSGSPRRKQLLTELGYTFRVISSNVDETPSPGLAREEIALSIAKRKTSELMNKLADDEILITADTIVWIENQLLEKPKDESEAFRMLSILNGQTHQVYTGVCLATNANKIVFSSKSNVTFKKVKAELLLDYIHQCKPFDKAGSYGAQECLPEGKNYCSDEERQFLFSIGQPFLFEKSLAVESGKHFPIIDAIEGSYFNVMGLPIVELHKHLLSFLPSS